MVIHAWPDPREGRDISQLANGTESEWTDCEIPLVDKGCLQHWKFIMDHYSDDTRLTLTRTDVVNT